MAKRNKDQDIRFLADRLALALTIPNNYPDELKQGILLLPSREDDRELIRTDPVLGRYYDKMMGVVRQILRDQVSSKANGSGRIPVRVKKRGQKIRRSEGAGTREPDKKPGDSAKDSH